ncbi:MAG: putative rane protein, partial [Dehalococcoidia bacterium]|nr:putative rane protein [Dehalococcoidia bacterium]
VYLQDNQKLGDYVIHDNKLSYFPTYYLAPDLPQGFVADPPGSPHDTLAPGTMDAWGTWPSDPAQAAQDNNRVWYVVYEKALEEAALQGISPPNKSWFDERYPLLIEARVGDLRLYLYRTAYSNRS